eukprot:6078925-Pleurochrysis_carterae.AAC.2
MHAHAHAHAHARAHAHAHAHAQAQAHANAHANTHANTHAHACAAHAYERAPPARPVHARNRLPGLRSFRVNCCADAACTGGCDLRCMIVISHLRWRPRTSDFEFAVVRGPCRRRWASMNFR